MRDRSDHTAAVQAGSRAEPFPSLKFVRPDGRGYAIASRPDEVADDGGTTAVVTLVRRSLSLDL